MAETHNFKYNINAQIELLPRNRTLEVIARELEKEGIAERTFYRDKQIKLHEASDIPSERLMIYAKFFGVNIDQLFNYSAKVKPIRDRKLTPIQKKIIERSGLKKRSV